MSEQTITLNNRPHPYTEGSTIKTLMEEKNYSFSHIIAKINDTVIEDENWHEAKVAPGDNVEIIHIFGGG